MLWQMPLFEGMPFTLRENQITIGTGVVTKLLPPITGQYGNNLSKWKIGNL